MAGVQCPICRKPTSTFSLANGFVFDRVWCSHCHALLRSDRDTRRLRRISSAVYGVVLAGVWALLLTEFGDALFQAIGFWVFPFLILASGAVHLLLSALAVLVFGRRITLELRGTERAT